MKQQRCINCGKTHVAFGETIPNWYCGMCGKMNYADTIDTREAFNSKSPLFGANLCPGVEVKQDGNRDPESK